MKLVNLMMCLLIVTPGMAMGNDEAWQFSIGAGIEREPAYTGSDVYSSEALLDFRVDYQLSDSNRLWLSLGEIGTSWDFNGCT